MFSKFLEFTINVTEHAFTNSKFPLRFYGFLQNHACGQTGDAKLPVGVNDCLNACVSGSTVTLIKISQLLKMKKMMDKEHFTSLGHE